jgi:transcriptional regulator GlxA family with amidase domain
MHLVLAREGVLRFRSAARAAWTEAPGVLTAADAAHEIDARGVDVLLVFLDPQSDCGAALASAMPDAVRIVSEPERTALATAADPRAIMRADGVEWTRNAVEILGGRPSPSPAPVHPRVRKLLRTLHAQGQVDTSLEALAAAVGLSPGRLMHVFTTSIGIPLRPYLTWLKVQRAAAVIASGGRLVDAAHAAGFADAAHMTRTFRRMLGAPPSALRPS